MLQEEVDYNTLDMMMLLVLDEVMFIHREVLDVVELENIGNVQMASKVKAISIHRKRILNRMSHIEKKVEASAHASSLIEKIGKVLQRLKTGLEKT